MTGEVYPAEDGERLYGADCDLVGVGTWVGQELLARY